MNKIFTIAVSLLLTGCVGGLTDTSIGCTTPDAWGEVRVTSAAVSLIAYDGCMVSIHTKNWGAFSKLLEATQAGREKNGWHTIGDQTLSIRRRVEYGTILIGDSSNTVAVYGSFVSTIPSINRHVNIHIED